MFKFSLTIELSTVLANMVVCPCPLYLMGRTVPTWRNRIEAELESLNGFRRALNSIDRKSLSQLIDGVRNRRTAGGMLPAHDSWKPMLLSMLLECYARITELERNLMRLVNEERGD